MLKMIKFGADWCHPCKKLQPIVEKVAADLGPEVISLETVTLTDDDQDTIMQKWVLTSIPTVIVLDNNEEVFRFTGTRTVAEVKALIQPFIDR